MTPRPEPRRQPTARGVRGSGTAEGSRDGGRMGGCPHPLRVADGGCGAAVPPLRSVPGVPSGSPYLSRAPNGSCGAGGRCGAAAQGSVLGGLPSFSALPVPHPRPMGQLWGCRQAAAGVGAAVPPMHLDSVVGHWGGSPPSPLLLLIRVLWGSCGAAGRRQLGAGGSCGAAAPLLLCSGAQCRGALGGLPSAQCSVPHPCPVKEL